MCYINAYADSNLILTKVYYLEKSETRKLCSAEIQERMKLSNSPQTSTIEWQRDFLKIKLYTEKEVQKKCITSCVKLFFFFFACAENPG